MEIPRYNYNISSYKWHPDVLEPVSLCFIRDIDNVAAHWMHHDTPYAYDHSGSYWSLAFSSLQVLTMSGIRSCSEKHLQMLDHTSVAGPAAASIPRNVALGV
jgi:hypothetical protein